MLIESKQALHASHNCVVRTLFIKYLLSEFFYLQTEKQNVCTARESMYFSGERCSVTPG